MLLFSDSVTISNWPSYTFNFLEFFISQLIPIVVSVILTLIVTMLYDSKRNKEQIEREKSLTREKNIERELLKLENFTDKFMRDYLNFKSLSFNVLIGMSSSRLDGVGDDIVRNVQDQLMIECSTFNTGVTRVMLRLKELGLKDNIYDSLNTLRITTYNSVMELSGIYQQLILNFDGKKIIDFDEKIKSIDFMPLILTIANISISDFTSIESK